MGPITTALLYYCYLFMVTLAFALGIWHWKGLDKPARIFAVLVGVSFVAEGLALAAELFRVDNNTVYNMLDMVQMVVVCLYFNEVTMFFKRHNIGVWLAVVSLILGWVTNFTLPQESLVNQYYLLFSGVLVMVMCLFLMVQLYRESEARNITSYPHFWLGAALLFHWACNLIGWQLYNYAAGMDGDYAVILSNILLISNFTTFTVIAFVFSHTTQFSERKKININGR